MSETPTAELVDLLAARHRDRIERGWPAIPEYVFCSDAGGGSCDERHFSRVWER